MSPKKLLLLAALPLALSACSAAYSLVQGGKSVTVAGAMSLRPDADWNRAPRAAVAGGVGELWTRNGPELDQLLLIAGLPDKQAMSRQRSKDDRQVPEFRADMSANDLTSMLESYYRVRGGASIFSIAQVAPREFLGARGQQMDFSFVGGDELKRRGRAVMVVRDGRFWCLAFDAAASHYFDASSASFDALVSSAGVASAR